MKPHHCMPVWEKTEFTECWVLSAVSGPCWGGLGNVSPKDKGGEQLFCGPCMKRQILEISRRQMSMSLLLLFPFRVLPLKENQPGYFSAPNPALAHFSASSWLLRPRMTDTPIVALLSHLFTISSSAPGLPMFLEHVTPPSSLGCSYWLHFIWLTPLPPLTFNLPKETSLLPHLKL